MKRVLVLGCTGSIGSQTLDIIRHCPQQFTLAGLSCGTNKAALQKLCDEFHCPGTLYSEEGKEGLARLLDVAKADIAVNGVAGSAGLEPSVMVLDRGISLALANKETVVMAWDLVKALAQKNNASIIPVDSEHSAVFCLINQAKAHNVSELVITASGGPFRTWSKEELKTVSLSQALKHPTWQMGPKITIDSASLANKGLEVIEAAFLFDVTADQIEVVVHPQSLIHSLVRTNDGELYAQISEPDMKHPILCALNWPDNKACYMEQFDLFDKTMSFFRPRMNDFPLLSYAFECVKFGKCYPIAFNAANEVAVHAFIEKKITYPQIAHIVRSVLDRSWNTRLDSFETVFEADKRARAYASELL